MKPKISIANKTYVKVDITIRDSKNKSVKTKFDDIMLKEQFVEFFHDYCRTFFCKSTLLKMPPQPAMEYNYKCSYSYEWLPSKKFGTTLIVHSELTTEYLIFHVKDLKNEEHIL